MTDHIPGAAPRDDAATGRIEQPDGRAVRQEEYRRQVAGYLERLRETQRVRPGRLLDATSSEQETTFVSLALDLPANSKKRWRLLDAFEKRVLAMAGHDAPTPIEKLVLLQIVDAAGMEDRHWHGTARQVALRIGAGGRRGGSADDLRANSVQEAMRSLAGRGFIYLLRRGTRFYAIPATNDADRAGESRQALAEVAHSLADDSLTKPHPAIARAIRGKVASPEIRGTQSPDGEVGPNEIRGGQKLPPPKNVGGKKLPSPKFGDIRARGVRGSREERGSRREEDPVPSAASYGELFSADEVGPGGVIVARDGFKWTCPKTGKPQAMKFHYIETMLLADEPDKSLARRWAHEEIATAVAKGIDGDLYAWLRAARKNYPKWKLRLIEMQQGASDVRRATAEAMPTGSAPPLEPVAYCADDWPEGDGDDEGEAGARDQNSTTGVSRTELGFSWTCPKTRRPQSMSIGWLRNTLAKDEPDKDLVERWASFELETAVAQLKEGDLVGWLGHRYRNSFFRWKSQMLAMEQERASAELMPAGAPPPLSCPNDWDEDYPAADADELLTGVTT